MNKAYITIHDIYESNEHHVFIDHIISVGENRSGKPYVLVTGGEIVTVETPNELLLKISEAMSNPAKNWEGVELHEMDEGPAE